MALGALSLSTTQGVRRRPFQATINGLTTGNVRILEQSSPAFSIVNGKLRSERLPDGPVATVTIREYEPGVGAGYRDTTLDISVATQDALLAQATGLIGGGRSLRSWLDDYTALANGEFAYRVLANDDQGAMLAASAGGGTPTPTPVTGDPILFTARGADPLDVQNAIGVDGERWTATITIKGLAPGGTVDASKLSLTTSDPGYDTSGNATAVSRTIVGHQVLRHQYVPGNAARVGTKMVYAAGSDVEITVALSDIIYAGTTIQSVTIDAGFYTGSNASEAGKLTIANESTQAYLKPHAVWDDLPYGRETSGTLRCAVVPVHREGRNGQMVPFVRYEVSDGSNTATATCNSPALSTTITNGYAPECYSASVNIAALTNGAITRNAKVYPWIGDASAILDMIVDRADDGTRLQQRAQPLYKDTGSSYGGGIVYVNPNATYTPLSSAANGGFVAANAFDFTQTTGFISTAIADPYLGMQFPSAFSVQKIAITPVDGAVGATPTAVVLEYSDDGTTWTQHGSASAFSAWSAGLRQVWDFGAGAPAKAYWRIRRAGGSTAINIGELEFIPEGGATTACKGYVDKIGTLPRLLPVNYMAGKPGGGTAPNEGAIMALQRFNNLVNGHNDCAGGTIYLMDNAGAAQVHQQSTSASAAVAGLCWTEVKVDPLATGAVTWGGATAGGFILPSLLLWSVPVTANASQPLFQSSGSTTGKFIAFKNVTMDTTGQTGTGSVYGFADAWYLNVTDNTTSTSNSIFGHGGPVGQRSENAFVAGCAYPSGNIATNTALANTTQLVAGSGASPEDPWDGLVWANNYYKSRGVALNLSATERGLFFVQNLVERYYTGTTGVMSLNINADGSSGVVNECLEIYNACLGERGSRNYSDAFATIGQKRKFTQRFTILQNVNKKTDTFNSAEAGHLGGDQRTGNWEWCYDTGSMGNVYIDGTVSGAAPQNDAPSDSYLGMYISPTTSWSPLAGHAAAAFTDPKAYKDATYYNGGNSTGGGNYRLTSDAAANVFKSKVPAGRAMLKYDILGTARFNDGTGAAGALERV